MIYIYMCVCVCVSLTHLFKDPPALNPPQESSLSSSTDSCFTDGLPSMENQLGHPHDRSGRHKHWRPCRPPVEAKSLWSPWRPQSQSKKKGSVQHALVVEKTAGRAVGGTSGDPVGPGPSPFGPRIRHPPRRPQWPLPPAASPEVNWDLAGDSGE